MKLKDIVVYSSLITLGTGVSNLGWADDTDLDDVTITVVDEDDTPETAFELIALPVNASATGVANSQKGVDTANAARADGKAFGQATAEAAKSKSEEAKDNATHAAEDAANQHLESIKDLVSSKVPDVAQDKIPTDVLDSVDEKHRPDPPNRPNLPPQVPNRP